MADNFENLGPRWYVVHTYSGYENKVKTNLEKMIENRGLQDVIFEVRIPLMTTVEVGEGGEKEKEEKLFPCYVLVKMEMSDATWHVVRNITGVTGFVGPGSKPVPLSDKEVEAMGIETKVVNLSFEIGDRVKILSTDYEGTVTYISGDKKRAVVQVSMLVGRPTPIEVDVTDVKKITNN